MVHARVLYNRIQDPALEDASLLSEGSTPIAEDEPVILFRAQDKHFVAILHHFRYLVSRDGDAKPEQRTAISEALARQAQRAVEWQSAHPPKSPDVPLGAHVPRSR